VSRKHAIGWMLVSLLVLVGTASGVLAQAGPDGRYAVTLEFEGLAQGNVGVVTVTGEAIAGARARFLNRLIDFYPGEDAWHGLLAANMEQSVDDYPLEVFVWFEDGERETWEGTVAVVEPDPPFIRQDITIASNLGYLLEPEVDRSERARLTAIFAETTTIHYWDSAGFTKPLNTDFTSPFGAWRLYNEALWGRHTGIDMKGASGTPLLAPASGRIVLAEDLDIRGGYVLIDHGWGIYSGIAHLSELYVTRGQVVQQGQVVGISGSTGRSSGPHIHWEIAVNGEWVDPAQFLNIAIP
jgi:hypothetical protein